MPDVGMSLLYRTECPGGENVTSPQEGSHLSFPVQCPSWGCSALMLDQGRNNKETWPFLSPCCVQTILLLFGYDQSLFIVPRPPVE